MNHYRYLPTITGLFVAVLLISGIVSSKIISLGFFEFDGGTLLFPLSYIFGDILTEVYGYKRSRIVIRTGFFAMALMSGMIFLVGYLPAGGEWGFQTDYNNILMLTPRIFLASIISYLVGEFINSYTLAKLKLRTQGKKLFLRLIGSTVIGEAFDTTLFVLIAFAGLMSSQTLLVIALSNYIFKVGIEIVVYPGTKKLISFLKDKEKVDHFDEDTNFNPFAGIQLK